ncbi:MAG TPA: hypothetical protein VGE52_00775 [Pirellulales bacterium]
MSQSRFGWRWRFSLRTLLLLTIISCLLFRGGDLLVRRSIAFSEKARLNRSKWASFMEHNIRSGDQHSERETARAYFLELWVKYARAARYPWAPVEPDPPAPVLRHPYTSLNGSS